GAARFCAVRLERQVMPAIKELVKGGNDSAFNVNSATKGIHCWALRHCWLNLHYPHYLEQQTITGNSL
ncbi:MAG: hypothetical protein ABI144_09500, partial [Gallionella sp.]